MGNVSGNDDHVESIDNPHVHDDLMGVNPRPVSRLVAILVLEDEAARAQVDPEMWQASSGMCATRVNTTLPLGSLSGLSTIQV